MDKNCLASLELAFKMANINYTRENLKEKINAIVSYEDIKAIARDCNNILNIWIPVLVFDIFGYSVYKSCDLNVDSNETYLIFIPGEDIDLFLQEQIEKNNFILEEERYIFSKKLIAILHGGFPWFSQYCKACEYFNLWEKEGKAYKIRSLKGDCVNQLVELKNQYRKEHKEHTKILRLQKEKYDGIINSFHTPNCIENAIHCKAIEKHLR